MSLRIAVHYDEIGLKGGNRPFFERKLKDAVKAALELPGARIRTFAGRLLLEIDDEAAWDRAAQALGRVFGIAHFGRVWPAPADIDAIAQVALAILPEAEGLAFAVRARRADKAFPMTSPEINRVLGAKILAARRWRVDLENPAVTLLVSIVGTRALVSCERLPGRGGLPLGASGKVACLLSGGIDSPVAAYRMMRRGARPVFVHCHGFPYTTRAGQEKARRLAAILLRGQGAHSFWQAPLAEIQQRIVADCPKELRVLLYRRFMFRLAERIAAREGAQALVTGEALGQVASQTIANMGAVAAAVALPVLRPLVGCDKKEIIAEARAIGTYEVSIERHEDCCGYLLPPHPATRSTAAELEAAEAALPVAELVDAALAGAERENLTAPASEP
ncbi:MAG TPA: tRNA uracil 4-sulfurtransferase ThiI [Planctomycetota bacterium]|jgi:thiamine biosynthesis protein ThiI|nr:tRNA 4-thiouridine(8) synthase ThiI [Planctomycetota bacterium]OQC21293.1 MAG: putative tRNA sulfurtransferase [Planctomycetes bacterium ADurb.Bin069]NMD34613.1 tRNA 4-thiouridine(8) synthase ThiI [Planctomycetota bacterium]HNR99175.1 tRNA uracil 4-sulfurtransferase ThiI [Planctomycetota bacterium]HNU25248.1 tRNA uracil 4-sulfurtransferase ThiI [Planctomycetota bacterium]